MSVVIVGSYNHDLIFNTKALPNEGETLMGDVHTGHGGKGFNQAVACKRLGADTTFIGAVGDDNYAAKASKFAEAEGVDCHWQTFDGLSTGLASVTTDDEGHNLIVVAPGANLAMTSEFIEESGSAFDGAAIVATQLESNLEAACAALEMGRAKGALTMLNPAPINGNAKKDMFALADVLTPNKHEFEFMLKNWFGTRLPHGWEDKLDEQIHEWCESIGVDTVVITMGDRGCFVSHSRTSKIDTERTCYRVPATPVRAVDSTGAGDAFCGALMASMARGTRDFKLAVEFANRAAALSVTRSGAAPAMPRLDEMN